MTTYDPGELRASIEPATWLEKAIEVAVRAHAGQRDRSDRPYILHPLRVMHKLAGKVKTRPDGDLILAAAAMHDVPEDTDYSLAELRNFGFPARVIELVDLMTHIKEEDKLTYRQYIERLAKDPDAVLIKLADLNDNLFHPARRAGWIGHEGSKRRYLGAWFYLSDGVWQ